MSSTQLEPIPQPKQGIVDVRPAYSEAPEDGVTFVQDRTSNGRADVGLLVQQGATVFVCGDGQNMAPAVFSTCARIYSEATGVTAHAAEEWLAEMQRDHARSVADVFA
jgi:cytochrome P450/NADPH-cytochrome P450 reductase